MITSFAFLPVNKIVDGVIALLGKVIEELVTVVNGFKKYKPEVLKLNMKKYTLCFV